MSLQNHQFLMIEAMFRPFLANLIIFNFVSGKSLLEALILALTNPQYDKSLFIELRVHYMKITSSEHVVYID